MLAAAIALAGGGGQEEADDDEDADADDLGDGLKEFDHGVRFLAGLLRAGLENAPSVSSRAGMGAVWALSLRLTTCCGGSFTMFAISSADADARECEVEATV